MDNQRMLISVIPAAGLGTRLGSDVPKLFVQITPTTRVIDLLESSITQFVDECCFVIRPDMIDSFKEYSTESKSTFVIQQEPLGMGDAIFTASNKFQEFEDILIIWGDQISLSKETLEKVIMSHMKSGDYCTIPLVQMQNPYVHYEISRLSKLTNLFQSREGDILPSIGFSDIGVFLIKTENLIKEWHTYLENKITMGNATNEINFLPFLLFLSQSGKSLNFPMVDDPFESIGMNTPSELEKLRNILEDRER